MKKIAFRFSLLILLLLSSLGVKAQHSVARQWNEVLLEGIRHDLARPTIHARNLFHSSVLMYDAWAVYDPVAEPYFLGKRLHDFACLFTGISVEGDRQAAQEEAISYAAYRLLKHRFSNSPGAEESLFLYDSLMDHLGYDRSFISTNYSTGNPATLGNYLAEQMILYGLQDGSNEAHGYRNRHYRPANAPLIPVLPGNPVLLDVNRWQPLALETFVDQGGNLIAADTIDFLSPEWGEVAAFALKEEDLSIYRRNNYNYWVYHDPGAPPHLDTSKGLEDYYKWSFSLVSTWSSHMDTTDGVIWDISPASIGNVQSYPRTEAEMRQFYDLREGGDPGKGYTVNPATGLPYQPQYVRRGDYARVLAEFWADGPDSETPPGHWFTLLNYVNDHPLFEKRLHGEGPVLNELEWDVKAYFAMGGAMHDAAIGAWACKGWYDYLRPISALRYMADRGQSSDPNKPRFNPRGLPLIPGLIEQVDSNDVLVGPSNVHWGKIKVKAWMGPDSITDPADDMAGVGWILAENWWPYQRPTFVTPPFAGYLSGHSTFSRAAAEIMTLLTGDPYFPGGMGEFYAPKNQFLVFEEGPSEDIVLQWAKYTDASDQCSLSRIWGGIHPPVDDMPGRIMGEEIAKDAYSFALSYFSGEQGQAGADRNLLQVYPNPVPNQQDCLLQNNFSEALSIQLLNLNGEVVYQEMVPANTNAKQFLIPMQNLSRGLYLLRLDGATKQWTQLIVKQ
ncbi:DUF6851 domain-containing protein [Croceimicrobium hydrocarbonivorans]|uniref:T9SS type A sorting domain-containing protein n=1 Tax=Croceimicrobium hydrocarbonivorans TaxID=2761580 RepID=A0A7H0VFB3_9FLAO|nr:T9SS type A sorting domain-containing protein [Croceimicrobium hydrocarbonivorans]QNR24411.1 T9SS type A sorting domain-containing protein [Croceimicrobium hydrocarbonivorans]